MATVGATVGAVIPSALYAGGKGLKAVLKKEMAQTVDQPFGRTPFEELRVVQPEKKTIVNKLFGSNIVQKIKRGLTSSAGMPQPLADIHTNNLRKLTAMEEDISRNISDFEIIFKKHDFKKRDFNTLSEVAFLGLRTGVLQPGAIIFQNSFVDSFFVVFVFLVSAITSPVN